MSISAWNSDKKVVAAAFYSQLDIGAISDGVRKIETKAVSEFSTLPQKWEYWASGRHFQVYKFATTTIAYAIKIASHELFNDSDNRQFIDYKRKIHLLKQASCYLVPPCEIMEVNNTLVLIQPLATETLDKVSEAYKPFAKTELLVHESLRQQGFVLKDTLQFKCWNRIPLLIDLSDLMLSTGV